MNPIAHITDAIAFLGGAIAPRPEPVLPTDIPAHDHRPGAACPRCAFSSAYPMFHAKIELFVAEAEQAAMPPTAIAALARAMVAYSSGYRKPASELLALALGRALRDGGATPEELGLAPATVAVSGDLMPLAIAAIECIQIPAGAAYLSQIANAPTLTVDNRQSLFADHLRGTRCLPEPIVVAIAAQLDRAVLLRHADEAIRADRVEAIGLLRNVGILPDEVWSRALNGPSLAIVRAMLAAGTSPSATTTDLMQMGLRPLGYALFRSQIGGGNGERQRDLAAVLIDAGAPFADGIIPSTSALSRIVRKTLADQVTPIATRSTRCTAYHWLARIAEGWSEPLPDLPPADRAWLAEQAAAAPDTYGLRVLAALSATQEAA